jgi:hypothetical protein
VFFGPEAKEGPMADQQQTAPPDDGDNEVLEPDDSPEATAEAGLTDHQVEEVRRRRREEEHR